MQKPLLATGKTASRPYEIRLIGRSVYSVEELCYSLEQCAAFADESIADPALCRWLENECGLRDLAAQLEPLMREPSAAVEEVVLRILAYVGFQSPQQIRQVRDVMESGKGTEPFQRRLREADLLASQGRETAALQILGELAGELPPLERMIRSQVWAAKARIHAGSFRFGQALACCEEAFRLTKSRQDCLRMLSMRLLASGEEEYRRYLEQHPSLQEAGEELDEYLQSVSKAQTAGQQGRQMKRLEKNLQSGKTGAFDSAMQQILTQEQELFRAGHAASF